MRKGIILGVILSIGAVIANIFINGFHSSYVYYSNYLLLIGTAAGFLGGIFYVLYWMNDIKLMKKIYYKEELPEVREEIEYLKRWGSYLIIAMFFMWFLAFIFAFPYYLSE
jgi:Na+/proline symporter